MQATRRVRKHRMTTEEKPQLRKYTIIGRYQRLLIAKTGMPLFVSFHPNSVVKFTIPKMASDKLPSFLKSIKSWFENLRIIKIEETDVSA